MGKSKSIDMLWFNVLGEDVGRKWREGLGISLEHVKMIWGENEQRLRDFKGEVTFVIDKAIFGIKF